ncbi:MAG: MvdC/MvdD family ATP grasp protein [Candidatus Helarchaeota archaeon]
MILFITNKEDITTDFVVKRIKKSSTDYYRFNTEDIFEKIDISLDFKKNKFQLLDKRKGVIDLNKITSVYFRRPKLPNILPNLETGERNFLIKEYHSLLNGIYSILSNRLWINYIYSIIEAENKIYQLILAKKLGFRIPETIITNNREYAYKFIKANSYNCIIKPIRSGFISDSSNPKIIFTNKIDRNKIEELKRIQHCPSIFQNNIAKEADVRVTVVGEKIFSARIESKRYEENMIDWRRGSNIIEHNYIELPSKIANQCINLVKQLNLIFGAIDLILDQEGNFHFLEINPNGQWAWIEKRLDMPISNEIANLLLGE